MNNEQQTWILKPGIDLRIVDLKDGLSFVHYVDDYVQWETEHVNALFMKLDVAGLTRQVEELIQTHDYVQAANQPMESNWDLEVTSFAEQIVLLLLNQEGETK
jgi:hypothetical protein